MFKQDLSVYLVRKDNSQFKLPVYEDVSYSQVYSEQELSNKTLHNPERLISTSYVSYLNPGNFNFTVPIISNITAQTLFSTLFKLEAFDLYYTNTKTIRLVDCVVDRITFNTTKEAIVTASISGSYSLTEDVVTSIPGVLVADTDRIYTYISGLGLFVSGIEQQGVHNFNIELSNSIEWLNRNFMQDINPSYSRDFVVKGRNLSGNFSLHEDLAVPTYGTFPMDVVLRCGNETFLQFIFPSITFTSRPQLDTLAKRGVDFKINQHVSNQVMYKGVNIWN